MLSSLKYPFRLFPRLSRCLTWKRSDSPSRPSHNRCILKPHPPVLSSTTVLIKNNKHNGITTTPMVSKAEDTKTEEAEDDTTVEEDATTTARGTKIIPHQCGTMDHHNGLTHNTACHQFLRFSIQCNNTSQLLTNTHRLNTQAFLDHTPHRRGLKLT